MAEWEQYQEDPGGGDAAQSRDFADDSDFHFTFKRKAKRKTRRGAVEEESPDFRRKRRSNVVVEEEVEEDVLASQFFNEFVNWDRDRIREWQEALVAAGYLKKDDYIEGYADSSTLRALSIAAEEASLRKKPLTDVLAERAELFKEKGDEDEESFRKQREDEYTASLYRSYTKIWGTLPPPNVIESAVSAGVNMYEFEYNEKQKPAYVNSPDYQMNRIGVEGRLADRFGALG